MTSAATVLTAVNREAGSIPAHSLLVSLLHTFTPEDEVEVLNRMPNFWHRLDDILTQTQNSVQDLLNDVAARRVPHINEVLAYVIPEMDCV